MTAAGHTNRRSSSLFDSSFFLPVGDASSALPPETAAPAGTPVLRSQYLRVAAMVLERQRTPMSARALVDFASDEKWLDDKLAGKTPHQTMKAKLSVHVRRLGDKSVFVRTSPGRFYLRALLSPDSKTYSAPALRRPPETLPILVFPREVLSSSLSLQGISRNYRSYSRAVLRGGLRYLDRLTAETTDAYKQVLTYVIVRDPKGRVLAFRRGNLNRVEDYLRGAGCIGFGGHVSHEDATLFNYSSYGIVDSAIREITEELALPSKEIRRLSSSPGAIRPIGVLNDDSSDVGRRHFAFLFECILEDPSFTASPKPGEKSITQLRWLDLASESVSLWDFEYWSQLCLRTFFSEHVRASPTFRIRRIRPFRTPHVLVVAGPIGSGKSEITRILCTRCGYTEVNSGRVLARLLRQPPVSPSTRAAFQELAGEFILKKNGPARLARAVALEVRSISSGRILIDGLRHPASLAALRAHLPDQTIALLYVHTSPDLAARLFHSREGKAPESTLASFFKVRSAPVEAQVGRLLSQSDAVLYNWFGVAALERTVLSFLSQVQGTSP